jgi:hypothetical protein
MAQAGDAAAKMVDMIKAFPLELELQEMNSSEDRSAILFGQGFTLAC